MKSLRAQGVLEVGKIVQVEPLPVEGTVSGYNLVCAGVPPAPAAHWGPSWANCPPVCGKKYFLQLVSPGQGQGVTLEQGHISGTCPTPGRKGSSGNPRPCGTSEV